MKFTVERDPFADAVAWAAKSAATRPLMPHLLGMVIDANGSHVTLSGYDLEVSGQVAVLANVDFSGRALVSARLLAEITRSLPNKPISVSLDGSKVFLTCGTSKFSLPTLSLNEYPALPEVPAASGVIDGELFATAVSQVAIAAGRDDSLPILTGINVEIENEKITMVATDRYRLAVRELTWKNDANLSATALIRGRTLLDAARAMAGADEVTVGLSPTTAVEQRIGFKSDGRTMTSRLLDGTFPPYAHLLPTEASSVAVVEVTALLEAVRRVALVTEKTVPLRMNFEGGTLRLEAGGGEDAQAVEELEISFEGDPITIAFNASYLADGLTVLDQPFAQLSFIASGKPAVLSGRSSLEGATDNSYRYLLMPMRYPS